MAQPRCSQASHITYCRSGGRWGQGARSTEGLKVLGWLSSRVRDSASNRMSTEVCQQAVRQVKATRKMSGPRAPESKGSPERVMKYEWWSSQTRQEDKTLELSRSLYWVWIYIHPSLAMLNPSLSVYGAFRYSLVLWAVWISKIFRNEAFGACPQTTTPFKSDTWNPRFWIQHLTKFAKYTMKNI